MMLLSFLSGLLWVQTAHAEPPLRPAVISPYANAVLDHVESQLPTGGSGNTGSCAPDLEQRTVESLREMFLQTDVGFATPQKDIARSVCHESDIQALELYVRDLMREALRSAESCDDRSAPAYAASAKYVWQRLFALRQYGLNPSVQFPVTGDEITEIPSNATSTDDDVLCPYDSRYAEPGFSGAGCTSRLLPDSASTTLTRETNLLEHILRSLQGGGARGLPIELPLFRGVVESIQDAVDVYVKSVSHTRLVDDHLSSGPDFLPRTQQNIGESGCLGWPSATAAAVVTGEDVPLQDYATLVLTPELADAIAFLKERENPKWYEYLRIFERQKSDEQKNLLYVRPGSALEEINRRHVQLETSAIFSLRDPQKQYENMANNLHETTRVFAEQASHFPHSPFDPALRDFVRRFATFLSRMCINRGCEANLQRAVELSLRDECFSSFTEDQFFRQNPSARTLPACQALYTE